MALFGKREKAYEVWGDKPRWKEARQRLKDAGIKVDIDENGSTFEENALIKANALRPYTVMTKMAGHTQNIRILTLPHSLAFQDQKLRLHVIGGQSFLAGKKQIDVIRPVLAIRQNNIEQFYR